MPICGQYTYSNYTLLNPNISEEELRSTSFHEYTHLMLTEGSNIGIMLYCFKKLVIPPNCRKDKIAYDAITGFMNNHTEKVQEGLAVFVECVILLTSKGDEACCKYVDDLKIYSRTYYSYVEPLLFILDIMKMSNDKEEILKTANVVFLSAIEAMDAELYQVSAENFKTNKQIQKMVSKADFSKEYLPDTRFKELIKICKKNAKSCAEIQEILTSKLSEYVKIPSLEANRQRLERIKEFIINFYNDSENIELYKNKLSKINTLEVDLNEIYLQQLPSIFNEEEVVKHCKIVDISRIEISSKELTSMILFLGTVEETTIDLYRKIGIASWSNSFVDYKNKEIMFFFGLMNTEIMMSVAEDKAVNALISGDDSKSVIVTTYKNYNYDCDCINNHRDITDLIFIYCDRTYSNAREYLDLWKNREVYYRYMQYNNMMVLIVKIAKNRLFILPMTTIVAYEADDDIRNNRKYMKMACDENDLEFDQEIITSDSTLDAIDTVINSLYFMFMKTEQ